MDSIASHLGVSLTHALGVVVSASVLYVAVAAVLRHWGRRTAATASTGTIALVTLVGPIAARATLGDAPTLAGCGGPGSPRPRCGACCGRAVSGTATTSVSPSSSPEAGSR